ncbi:MAG: hypothetical protein WCS70_06555 [Verrucomicrobiota bacterium]
MSYSVLFCESPVARLDTLAPIVRQVCGIPDYDARAKIRRGWGFLERDVTREEAERLAGAIAGCVAVENLRQPPDPRVMKGMEFTDTGIVPDGAKLIDWADLRIVAACAISEEIVRREAGGKETSTGEMLIGLGVFMATGIPPGLFGGKKVEKQAVKAKRWLTFGRLVTRQGEQFAFSLDHFNFAGLGDKKQLQAIANFRVFIAELQQRSPARLNYGAQLMLANQAVSLANYTSLMDFETELLWLFNVQATGAS